MTSEKHHDGVCMYDTRTTDYKVSAPDCPFHAHGNLRFTRKDDRTFCILLSEEQAVRPAHTVRIPCFSAPDGGRISLLGAPGELTRTRDGTGGELSVSWTRHACPASTPGCSNSTSPGNAITLSSPYTQQDRELNPHEL